MHRPCNPSSSLTILAGCLIASTALYTLHRAIVLRIEYHDGYDYLLNAQALLHPGAPYLGSRPPFLTLAQVPAMAIAALGPRDGPAWFVVPHLVSALLSLATTAAVFCVYRRALGSGLALLGTALCVVTPYFVRYGAHALADLPSAGTSTLALGLWLRARARVSAGAYGLAGVGLGLAVLTKFPVVFLSAAFVAAELAYGLAAWRFDRRRWGGLILCGAIGALLSAGTIAALLAATSSATAAHQGAFLRQTWTMAYIVGARHHESWRDYGPMILVMVSPPTLLLAALGLIAAVTERDARDLPFAAWLVALGGSVVFLVRHNEARYFLPALPALIYFSARGAGFLLGPADAGRSRRFLGNGMVAVLVAWAAACGARQALLDRDPVFRADVERQAASALVRARVPGSRLLWLGTVHTFSTQDPARLPEDEFFNLFHFPPFAVTYLTGEPVETIAAPGPLPDALVSQVRDGDAIFKTTDKVYETRTVPPDGVPPPEIWSVHRLVLKHATGPALVAAEDPAVAVRLHDIDGRLVMEPDADLGTWTVFVGTEGVARLRPLGQFDLRKGGEIVLATASQEAPTTVVLFRVDRMPFRPAQPASAG